MAMFSAYLDASGSQAESDGFVVVVGSVAHADNWVTFDRDWGGYLASIDLPTFHMENVAHHWKREEQERIALLRELATRADQTVERIFVTAFTLKDYLPVNRAYHADEELGGPYALAVYATMSRTVKWLLASQEPTDQFKMFIEQGDTGQTSLNRILLRAGLDENGYVFLPKRDKKTGTEYRPFHVADFVGYEYRVEMERRAQAKRPRPIRGSLRALANIIGVDRIDAATLDSSRLMQACSRLGIKKR